ncbi:membrane protein implicated in regulation of membrane protease activity [Pyrinomonas methylaliphatogenes]|uniref:Membrane protein implicated in regulation of membrane protease activity n=2 Tax=Pyrinomonas methylaliphatogenes TaxID=454194 RepID=A0A0B6WVB9_9BACT|nr:membrane protein implicated in regulation of membrane protease activity [Pyrinomonas methylaliphatogenes]
MLGAGEREALAGVERIMIWILWIVFGVILIIAEIFTTGFVLLWFGIGAFIAALMSLLGFGYVVQFIAFFFVSSVLTAASRTIWAKYLFREEGGTGLKTGVDALPGKVGTVVLPSRGALNEGAVKVYGSVWTAYPVEGEAPLEAGERVIVERVQGASIYVRRFDALPEWRRSELKDKNESA